MMALHLMKSKPVIQTENMFIPVKLESVKDDGYCIRLVLETDVNPESDLVLLMSDWPSGMNGMKLTSWASVLKVSVNH